VLFHKEAAIDEMSPASRRHIYGAVRFLHGAFTSFQIVASTSAGPSDGLLATLGEIVHSLR
jgi:hypothetical protein